MERCIQLGHNMCGFTEHTCYSTQWQRALRFAVDGQRARQRVRGGGMRKISIVGMVLMLVVASATPAFAQSSTIHIVQPHLRGAALGDPGRWRRVVPAFPAARVGPDLYRAAWRHALGHRSAVWRLDVDAGPGERH